MPKQKTKKTKTLTHEYDGPGGVPEAFTFIAPSVPIYIRVRAKREALDWKYQGTELGRRINELHEEKTEKDPEATITRDELEALIVEADDKDVELMRLRSLVGVEELVERIESITRDGRKVNKKDDTLMTWLLSSPTRMRALEAAAGEVFYSDDEGTEGSGEDTEA